MEISGKIKLIRDTQEVSSSFSKREFVVETTEQYPQLISLELHQDKCDIIDSYSVGQEVVCGINLRGREWSSPLGEVKYFNTIVCWKIQPSNAPVGGNNTTATTTVNTTTNPKEFGAPLPGEEESDLPF